MSIWMKRLKCITPRTGAVIRLVGADGWCPPGVPHSKIVFPTLRLIHPSIFRPVYKYVGIKHFNASRWFILLLCSRRGARCVVAPLLIDFKTRRYFTATLTLATISPWLCPDQIMTCSRHSGRYRASPSDFLHARCCVLPLFLLFMGLLVLHRFLFSRPYRSLFLLSWFTFL